MFVKRLLHTRFGNILVSILLGLGLATLFRKACNSRKCIVFKSPPYNELVNDIYKYDNKCYKFTEKFITCNKNKQKIPIS